MDSLNKFNFRYEEVVPNFKKSIYRYATTSNLIKHMHTKKYSTKAGIQVFFHRFLQILEKALAN